MRKIIAAAILITATGAVSAAGSERVGFSSLGKARIGLSERALASVFGAPLVHTDPVAEEEGCYYTSTPTLPREAGLMIVNGRLARIDVFGPGLKTVSGAKVGMSELALKRRYGTRLTQESHAYTGPEGHYLTLKSRDGKYGVRFETDGKVVTGYYAGAVEAIQYIEGCQ